MDLDLGNRNPPSGEWNVEFSTTPSVVNKTETASQVIAGFYALLFYLALLTLSILGVCFRACAQMLSSCATSALFLIGTLLACVNVFCNSHNSEVRVYFRLPTVFLVGIVFVLAGAVFFFSKAENVAQQTTLARQQPSMGLVVGVISFSLIIIEIFLLAAACVSNKDGDQNSWAVLADKTTFLVQKVIQAIVYILLLRYRTICPTYKESAKFYLKTLAFFNFIEWVDSQVNEENDINSSHADLIYKSWFQVLVVFYKALITDYRLLCSLLFLEHSLEDEMADNNDEENDAPNRNMTLINQQYRAAGFIFGLLSLSAPLCTAMYYVDKLHIPPWVHVFAIIVNLTIVGYGAIFLASNDLTRRDLNRNKESSGVQIMVCFLGAVGLVCWITKAPISGYWSATSPGKESDDSLYLALVATKYYARGVSTAFLMGLFLKVEVQTLARRNSAVNRNHFLVPAMMSTIIGAFAESLIDQYVGPVDSSFRKEINDASLKLLFTAGPPMYLGFLIHMVLHFVILQAEIVNAVELAHILVKRIHCLSIHSEKAENT